MMCASVSERSGIILAQLRVSLVMRSRFPFPVSRVSARERLGLWYRQTKARVMTDCYTNQFKNRVPVNHKDILLNHYLTFDFSRAWMEDISRTVAILESTDACKMIIDQFFSSRRQCSGDFIIVQRTFRKTSNDWLIWNLNNRTQLVALTVTECI